MHLSAARMGLYSRLLSRSASPLVVITNNRFQLLYGDMSVSRPVSLPIAHGNRIAIKLEHLQETSPTGSFYDRLYPWLFFRAESRGFIHPARTHLIECSVGNAGAAFAGTAQSLGYRNPIVIMPADIYPARTEQVRGFGAEVLFSPTNIGPSGYIQLLEEMLAEDWRRHGRPTKRNSSLYPISKIRKVLNRPYADFVDEVLVQLGKLDLTQQVDSFVFGVGAGNAVSEVGLAVRRANRAAKVIVCEHQDRPFVERLRKGQVPDPIDHWPEPDWPATTIHGVPLEKLNLNLALIDDVVLLSRREREDGWHIANDILGLFAGRPTGMMIAAALRVAQRVENQTILTLVFDHLAKYGEKYSQAVFSNLPAASNSRRALVNV
jgi:cysteine synthase